MPSRAYVAHDRAVSAARMYVQMAVVGFLLASVVYVGVMTTFLIPLCCRADSRATDCRRKAPAEGEFREPAASALFALKYYVSLNPKNYLSIQLSSKRLGGLDKREVVEPELQPFFRQREVPRETYRKAILWITRGRVEQLRWIFPISLLFFPVFGLLYFLAFSRLNRRSSKTEFVRGADLMPFERMKVALNQAIKQEEKDNPAFVASSPGRGVLAGLRVSPAYPGAGDLWNWQVCVPEPLSDHAQGAARF